MKLISVEKVPSCVLTRLDPDRWLILHVTNTSLSLSSLPLSLFYPLTARVVGAPQMVSQPVSSIFSFSTVLWDLPNSRPVHSLMSSSHLFHCLPCLLPPFTVPYKMVFVRPDKRETLHITAVCVFFNFRQEVFVWSNYLQDLSTNFLVRNMVFV